MSLSRSWSGFLSSSCCTSAAFSAEMIDDHMKPLRLLISSLNRNNTTAVFQLVSQVPLVFSAQHISLDEMGLIPMYGYEITKWVCTLMSIFSQF